MRGCTVLPFLTRPVVPGRRRTCVGGRLGSSLAQVDLGDGRVLRLLALLERAEAQGPQVLGGFVGGDAGLATGVDLGVRDLRHYAGHAGALLRGGGFGAAGGGGVLEGLEHGLALGEERGVDDVGGGLALGRHVGGAVLQGGGQSGGAGITIIVRPV